MDNFSFDVTAETDLPGWVKLCANGRKAVGWSQRFDEDGTPHLIFFWVNPTGGDPINQLPFAADSEAMAMTVQRWLADAEYGPEPNHDGSNGKGFRIYNEAWGHVDGHWQAFMGISPAWAMYGK